MPPYICLHPAAGSAGDTTFQQLDCTACIPVSRCQLSSTMPRRGHETDPRFTALHASRVSIVLAALWPCPLRFPSLFAPPHQSTHPPCWRWTNSPELACPHRPPPLVAQATQLRGAPMISTEPCLGRYCHYCCCICCCCPRGCQLARRGLRPWRRLPGLWSH